MLYSNTKNSKITSRKKKFTCISVEWTTYPNHPWLFLCTFYCLPQLTGCRFHFASTADSSRPKKLQLPQANCWDEVERARPLTSYWKLLRSRGRRKYAEVGNAVTCSPIAAVLSKCSQVTWEVSVSIHHKTAMLKLFVTSPRKGGDCRVTGTRVHGWRLN